MQSTTGASSSSSFPQLWWESLPEEIECPITLEPVNTLPYPPFILHSSQRKSTQLQQPQQTSTIISNGCHDIAYYFDGHALASYIVSRGIFQNPLTREKLTYEDCRRLDEYLEDYCYNENDANTSIGIKRFQVLEAFALRESVQVRTAHGHALNTEADEQQRRRAEFLRSEATAALSGLFVYGTANQRHRNQRQRQQLQQPNNNRNSNNYRAIASEPIAPSPVFGFDLNRTVTDPNAAQDDFGMVVIDDDEARVVEREQEAYQELQEAFPRLSTAGHVDDEDYNDDDDVSNGNNNHGGAYSPRTQAHLLAINDEKLDQIRQNAEQDRVQQEHRQRLLQQARQQLEQEARIRREERKRERAALKAQAEANYQKQQQEEDEVARARAEIERWREEQWERMRHIAEQEQQRRQEEERRAREAEQEQLRQQQLQEERDKQAEQQAKEQEEEAAKEAKLKAAKAAKRKRAKERKKQQKTQEQQEQEEKEKQAALEAKKKASTNKCAACQGGIVGVPFERYDHSFCSPKCARAGPSTA